jgi:hypothetical protein
MQKVRDRKTGLIRYVETEDDVYRKRLVDRINILEKKVKLLEDLVNKMNCGDIN